MASNRNGQLYRIAVLGCGPKAIALHVRSAALSNLNRKTVKVVSWDMHEPAANWNGEHGWTDGKCKLGTSPLKDVTFPGTFGKDPMLDKELVKFSWTSYLRCTGKMDAWVDKGYPPCTHKQWAEYLKWAFDESKGENRKGFIEKVEPHDGKVAVYVKGNKPEIFDGFVYTGPGNCFTLSVVGNRRIDRLLDARTFWQEKHNIKGEVCLIGTGESVAAILENFVDTKPDANISVVTMFGYLPMRDEGFSANSMFTKPSGWKGLPVDIRKTIINRADRGVLSPRCHEELAASQFDVKEMYGKVFSVKHARHGVEIEIEKGKDNIVTMKFDYVVAAIGFDILSALHKFIPSSANAETSELIQGVDHQLRLPQMQCNIHVPGLAGLAQGPGFPNLSCLGLTAARIFSAYE